MFILLQSTICLVPDITSLSDESTQVQRASFLSPAPGNSDQQAHVPHDLVYFLRDSLRANLRSRLASSAKHEFDQTMDAFLKHTGVVTARPWQSNGFAIQWRLGLALQRWLLAVTRGDFSVRSSSSDRWEPRTADPSVVRPRTNQAAENFTRSQAD